MWVSTRRLYISTRNSSQRKRNKAIREQGRNGRKKTIEQGRKSVEYTADTSMQLKYCPELFTWVRKAGAGPRRDTRVDIEYDIPDTVADHGIPSYIRPTVTSVADTTRWNNTRPRFHVHAHPRVPAYLHARYPLCLVALLATHTPFSI